MSESFRRFYLEKRDVRSLMQTLSRRLGIDTVRLFGSKPNVEVFETSKSRVYIINGAPLVASVEEEVFPTLFFKDYLTSLPVVYVDMGAIPHICNGADVMAPGVRIVNEDFEENELVLVVDERNKMPIAVSKSLVNAEALRKLRRGRVLKTLHYVGDDIWKIAREARIKKSI
ncbi:MAG: DUF1947 domain-containing protein [Nitrososphaerota archaeon]|nr:DUF1947 domain-containing protein [Candidatus Bathyarchaeota archaeon]MDW8048675.1 DUF1947 domain-containing protein [Nitrososphaerota archaeon]